MLGKVLVVVVLLVTGLFAYNYFVPNNPLAAVIPIDPLSPPLSSPQSQLNEMYRLAGASASFAQVSLPILETLPENNLVELRQKITAIKNSSKDPIEVQAIEIHITLVELAIFSHSLSEQNAKIQLAAKDCSSLSLHETQSQNFTQAQTLSVKLKTQLDAFIQAHPTQALVWNFHSIPSTADTDARAQEYNSGVAFLKETCLESSA